MWTAEADAVVVGDETPHRAVRQREGFGAFPAELQQEKGHYTKIY